MGRGEEPIKLGSPHGASEGCGHGGMGKRVQTSSGGGWAGGLRVVGPPAGAPRSERKGRRGAARSGYSGRAVQTEGGKRGGPTRSWRGGCHSLASLKARPRLLPCAPEAAASVLARPPTPWVRPPRVSRWAGAGDARCVRAGRPPGFPGPAPALALLPGCRD